MISMKKLHGKTIRLAVIAGMVFSAMLGVSAKAADSAYVSEDIILEGQTWTESDCDVQGTKGYQNILQKRSLNLI